MEIFCAALILITGGTLAVFLGLCCIEEIQTPGVFLRAVDSLRHQHRSTKTE